MNRRDYLSLIGVGGVAASLSGCDGLRARFAPLHAPEAAALRLPPRVNVAPAARLLNRAGFGPTPGDIARMTAMGRDSWLEQQLSAPTDDADESPALRLRLRESQTLAAGSPVDLEDFGERDVLIELQRAAILRAVYSPWQVRERMADFWTNHFNIYGHKNLGAFLKTADDIVVVRSHALGTFPDMLRASAHSPAMLGYLDNQQNRKGVPNENYARELMELHTLGVKGGYTQTDVQEVARCLTGWTVEDRFLHRKGSFRFDATRHDDGPKTVLGIAIPAGGGESDGDRVLDILAAHPATARHIAQKLVGHFVGGDSPRLATHVADIYIKTAGSIPAMLRTILTSPEFAASPPVLKRPLDFLVSSLRAVNAETNGGTHLQTHLANMGQPLFQWPMPDGYPDRTGAWTGTLLHRWNFAFALASGGIRGTTASLPADRSVDAHLEQILGCRAADASVAGLRATLAGITDSAEQTALLLASPTFQWR